MGSFDLRTISIAVVIALIAGAGAGYMVGNSPVSSLMEEKDGLEAEYDSLDLAFQSLEVELGSTQELLVEEQRDNEYLQERYMEMLAIDRENQILEQQIQELSQRNVNPQIRIRGLRWSGNADFEEVLEIGANYIQVTIWPQILKNGSISHFIFSDVYNLDIISAAHERGLRVYLEIYPARVEGHHVKCIGLMNVENFLENMENITLKWAKLADQYAVELFSPPNELFQYVGCNRAMEWYQEILPKIRAVYKGDVVPRGLQLTEWDSYYARPIETPLSEFNFSGWDYIANDFYANGIQSLDEFRICLRENIRKCVELEEKFGVKGILYGEISHLGRGNMTLEKDPIYDYLSMKVFLEENVGKVDGFFFWGWESFNHEKKLLLKNFYTFDQPYIDQKIEPIEVSRYVEEMDKIPSNVTSIIYQDDFKDLSKVYIHRNEQPLVHLTNGTLELFDGGAFSPIHVDTKWNDIHINGKIKIVSGTASINLRSTETYFFQISITPASYIEFGIKERPNRESDWMGGPIRQLDYLVETGVWHDFDVWAVGRWFALYIDGKIACNFYDSNAPLEGCLWIGASIPWMGSNEAQFYIDNLSIHEVINN